MRQTKTQLLVEQQPRNVIDVLTAGFQVVRKRPWILAIPIGLDASIWILPRLSLASLLRPLTQMTFDAANLPPDLADNAEQARQAVKQLIDSLDVLGIVAAALNWVTRVPALLRVPTLLALDNPDLHSPIDALAFTIQIQSALLALLLFLPLFFLGLFAVAIYLEWLAQGIRRAETALPGSGLTRAAHLWLKLIICALALGLLLFGAGMIIGIAQLLIGANDTLSSIMVSLFVVALIWLFVYLFFVVGALALDALSIREAVRRSVLILRAYFWASLGLVVLTALLDQALAVLWKGLLVGQLALVGIALNAAVGTALLAASMVFYQDRMIWVEKLRVRVRKG